MTGNIKKYPCEILGEDKLVAISDDNKVRVLCNEYYDLFTPQHPCTFDYMTLKPRKCSVELKVREEIGVAS